jgi:predicted HicB family RNase H-like nuclease
MAKAKKQESEKTLVRSVVLTEELHAKVGELAAKEDRSVSNWIIQAIKEKISRTEGAGGK